MSGHIVFAALALQLSAQKELRILPAGSFRADDGRPGQGRSWLLTPKRGQELVEAAQAREVDYNVDYEHQSILAAQNGQPAPAAGWFRVLAWRDDGLYTTDLRWTARALSAIAAKEYRYISPVFNYDPETLEVTGLINVALTNTPALHDQRELEALSVSLAKQQQSAEALAFKKDLARKMGMSVSDLDAAIAEGKAEELEHESAGLTQKQRQMLEHVNGGPLTS